MTPYSKIKCLMCNEHKRVIGFSYLHLSKEHKAELKQFYKTNKTKIKHYCKENNLRKPNLNVIYKVMFSIDVSLPKHSRIVSQVNKQKGTSTQSELIDKYAMKYFMLITLSFDSRKKIIEDSKLFYPNININPNQLSWHIDKLIKAGYVLQKNETYEVNWDKLYSDIKHLIEERITQIESKQAITKANVTNSLEKLKDNYTKLQQAKEKYDLLYKEKKEESKKLDSKIFVLNRYNVKAMKYVHHLRFIKQLIQNLDHLINLYSYTQEERDLMNKIKKMGVLLNESAKILLRNLLIQTFSVVLLTEDKNNSPTLNEFLIKFLYSFPFESTEINQFLIQYSSESLKDRTEKEEFILTLRIFNQYLKEPVSKYPIDKFSDLAYSDVIGDIMDMGLILVEEPVSKKIILFDSDELEESEGLSVKELMRKYKISLKDKNRVFNSDDDLINNWLGVNKTKKTYHQNKTKPNLDIPYDESMEEVMPQA